MRLETWDRRQNSAISAELLCADFGQSPTPVSVRMIVAYIYIYIYIDNLVVARETPRTVDKKALITIEFDTRFMAFEYVCVSVFSFVSVFPHNISTGRVFSKT